MTKRDRRGPLIGHKISKKISLRRSAPHSDKVRSDFVANGVTLTLLAIMVQELLKLTLAS